MSRQLIWSSVALLLVVTPSVAGAQTKHSCSVSALCGHPGGGVWTGVDFGAPKPVKPEPEERVQFQPLIRPVPVYHAGHVARPSLSYQTDSKPIDCAMAKPGDPKLDPKLVHTAAGHLTFAGKLALVAPCENKK